MKKSILVIATAAVITTGLLTSFAFAKDNSTGKGNVNSSESTKTNSVQKTGSYSDMIRIMEENGFGQQAKAMENNDYAAMDNFMNNISDEDYNKMINIMKESGSGMADTMQSIGKDNMINMHNAMGGAAGMSKMHR